MSGESDGAGLVIVRELGIVDYQQAWHAMQHFTDARGGDSTDELWCLQHPPVFTQGQAGRAEHILDAGNIPVIQANRGGQVTYHGPGQLVVYLLVDLRRKQLGVRALVDVIEQSIIALLDKYGVAAQADPKAPGVYVEGRKIAALGLRVRRGCSFHGLALNIETDLAPFARINPCGYAGMTVTRLQDEMAALPCPALPEVATDLVDQLCLRLGYNRRQHAAGLPLLR
jgi:lipoyl(octanoyl) transferase